MKIVAYEVTHTPIRPKMIERMQKLRSLQIALKVDGHRAECGTYIVPEVSSTLARVIEDVKRAGVRVLVVSPAMRNA